MTIALETSVLIVGAGPVGLSLALDLGMRGIDCIVVERREDLGRHSKVGLVSVRSMELFRRWGVEGRVRDCGFPDDYALSMTFCTSLSGHRIATDPYPAMRDERAPPQSPVAKQRCPQLWLDPILADCARQHDCVQIRSGLLLNGFTESDGSVLAELHDTRSGEACRINCRYLAGCDGAASTVRQQLGIEMHGEPVLSNSIGIYLTSPGLLRRHAMGAAERYLFVDEGGVWGNLTVVDGDALWRLTVIGSRDEEADGPFDAAHWVRRAFGSDEIPFTVDSVLPWRRSKLVAGSYGHGRVWLAGDSVHTMSPTGAFGMNTGIGDAADLGWKLAGALQGWGGPGLLDSYDAERRPVGVRNVEAAAANFHRLMAQTDYALVRQQGAAGDAARQRIGDYLTDMTRAEWRTLGVVLGYRYEGSPICIPDGSKPPADDPVEYMQTARPGHRAPHAWLGDGRSTLDLFGPGYTLLRFGASGDEMLDAARLRGMPVRPETIDDPAIATLYGAKLVLIRPDGHVAWRGDAATDPDAVLSRASGH